jgi:hypothetical protein
MPQTQSSAKTINNNPSIDFANDNFCAFLPNYFPSETFKNFKNSPHSLQNASLNFNNFKNNPSSAPNASSLFCAPLTLRLKTTRAGVCAASLSNPFSLKSAVKADFLTLEPNQDQEKDQDNNLNNVGFFKTLDNKLTRRSDALYKPKELTKSANDNKAKYYADKDNPYAAFYNPDTGESYFNLANINGNNDLIEKAIHEGLHPNEKFAGLNKDQEEIMVRSETSKLHNTLNFYYNMGSSEGNIFSKYTSWALSNANYGGVYNDNRNYLNNFYDNSTANVTALSLIGNGFAAKNVDRGKIEPYLMPKEKSQLVEDLKSCGANQGCKDQVQEKYQAISNPRDKEFDKLYASCEKGNCTKFNKIHYDLRLKLTQEGNDYWNSLTPKQKAEEFTLLPNSKSVYHTFIQDPNTGRILSGQNDNIKYVHPVYGYEVVLDANKNIVTNPLNAGTYNFYNPNMGQNNSLLEGFFNHKTYDVDPYNLIGNAANDPTTPSQRFWRFMEPSKK